MRTLAPLGVLSVLVASLVGCDGFGTGSPGSSVGDSSQDPTYVTDIAPMMDAYCDRCHSDPPRLGAPRGFRTDVYEDTDVWGLASVAPDCLDTMDGTSRRFMPPRNDPQMSAAEIDLFARWVEAGVPYDHTGAR